MEMFAHCRCNYKGICTVNSDTRGGGRGVKGAACSHLQDLLPPLQTTHSSHTKHLSICHPSQPPSSSVIACMHPTSSCSYPPALTPTLLNILVLHRVWINSGILHFLSTNKDRSRPKNWVYVPFIGIPLSQATVTWVPPLSSSSKCNWWSCRKMRLWQHWRRLQKHISGTSWPASSLAYPLTHYLHFFIWQDFKD